MVVEITVTRLLITLKKAWQHLLATKISASAPTMNLSKLKNRMLKQNEGEQSSSRIQVHLRARFRDAGKIEKESTEADNSGSAKKRLV